MSHLFFGNGTFPFERRSPGCARLGALCSPKAVGVVGAGLTSNMAAQSIMVAHEIAHSLRSFHDEDRGYVMSRAICRNCDQFSMDSIGEMKEFVQTTAGDKCTERIENDADAPKCLGVFNDRQSCNQEPTYSCTWRDDRNECWERA